MAFPYQEDCLLIMMAAQRSHYPRVSPNPLSRTLSLLDSTSSQLLRSVSAPDPWGTSLRVCRTLRRENWTPWRVFLSSHFVYLQRIQKNSQILDCRLFYGPRSNLGTWDGSKRWLFGEDLYHLNFLRHFCSNLRGSIASLGLFWRKVECKIPRWSSIACLIQHLALLR